MIDKAKSRPKRLPYFQFFADDWIAGTAELTFEERGFYIQVLSFQWSRRGALPLDILPLMLRCDGRMCRRLTARLVALGKLVLTPLGLANFRLSGMINMHQQLETIARTSVRLRCKVRAKSTLSFAKKPTKSTNHVQGVFTPYPEAEEERKKEREKPASNYPVAASEKGLAGWPDFRGDLISELARRLNPIDPAGAVPAIRTWLGCQRAGGYSDAEVGQAACEMATRTAEGLRITRPLAFLQGVLKTNRGNQGGQRQTEKPWVTAAKTSRDETLALLASMRGEAVQ